MSDNHQFQGTEDGYNIQNRNYCGYGDHVYDIQHAIQHFKRNSTLYKMKLLSYINSVTTDIWLS